jgi:hypothetical protein
MDKKIYIGKIRSLNNKDIWRVNGKYIRENFDPDFTNFGQHYAYPKFIPKNEFWLDREFAGGEEHYFIANLFVEHELMSKGYNYAAAHGEAQKVEMQERARDAKLRQVKKLPKKDVLKKIRKKLIKTYKDSLDVYVIDGSLVRGLYYLDFTIGGHDKVYDFVPENEIWIDDDVWPDEVFFSLIHELHERRLMAGGADYATAHNDANKVEFLCRAKPQLFHKKMQEEIEQIAA